MELHVTELEKDIIKEILNIGLARAADSFATVARDQVLLKVPDLQLIQLHDLVQMVQKYQGTHTLIQSDIKGDFNGTTLLLFSSDHIDKLTEVCLGENFRFDGFLSEMQQSLLLEISNIITGALVTQLANILKTNLYGSPPVAPLVSMADSLRNILVDHPLFQPLIFTVITEFTNKSKQLEMPLLLFFDTETFFKVLQIIRGYKLFEDNLFEGPGS
jgi:chemotaxis protein CheC